MTARKLPLSSLPDWPRALDREEAAAYLSISPNHLERLVPVQPVLIGARKLWDRAALDAFVSSLSGAATDRSPPTPIDTGASAWSHLG